MKKQKTNHTVGTGPKSNRIIAHRSKVETLKRHTHDHSWWG